MREERQCVDQIMYICDLLVNGVMTITKQPPDASRMLSMPCLGIRRGG